MRGVDLERYVFDTGLTLSILWMNADGTVYHRYGGRDARSADQWLSIPSMEIAMTASLDAHRTHEVIARVAQEGEPLTLERVPSFIKRDRGECIHCHSIRPALYEEQLADGTWTADKVWRFIPPSRIGLDLDRDDQRRVVSVVVGSPAAIAGVQVGDALVSMGGQAIATATDVMFELDRFDTTGGILQLNFERKGKPQTAQLKLAEKWKVGTAQDFAWRSFKWGLTPAPGFGGPQLDRDELRKLGLLKDGSEAPFAFRITYLVTWGDNKRYGQAASKAGLQEGDILLAVNLPGTAIPQLTSGDHFHAWWRLTVKPGDKVELEVLRNGERKKLELEAIE
jgi:serine protease Do